MGDTAAMDDGPTETQGFRADLRKARRRRGLSQRALAARTGVRQGSISLIESGKVDPGISKVVQLARAVGLEVVLVPRRAFPAVLEILRADEDGSGGRSAVELLVGEGAPADDDRAAAAERRRE